MNTNAGLWIDHHDAIIVTLSPTGTTTQHVNSALETQPRRAGEPPNGRFESQSVSADDTQQRQVTSEMNHYYDAVITSLKGAGALLIMGPGEAKGELRARLDHPRKDSRVISLETSDRMTEPQVTARVRSHFHAPAAKASH